MYLKVFETLSFILTTILKVWCLVRLLDKQRNRHVLTFDMVTIGIRSPKNLIRSLLALFAKLIVM